MFPHDRTMSCLPSVVLGGTRARAVPVAPELLIPGLWNVSARSLFPTIASISNASPEWRRFVSHMVSQLGVKHSDNDIWVAALLTLDGELFVSHMQLSFCKFFFLHDAQLATLESATVVTDESSDMPDEVVTERSEANETTVAGVSLTLAGPLSDSCRCGKSSCNNKSVEPPAAADCSIRCDRSSACGVSFFGE
jgi:hypothetical protein